MLKYTLDSFCIEMVSLMLDALKKFLKFYMHDSKEILTRNINLKVIRYRYSYISFFYILIIIMYITYIILIKLKINISI